MTVAAKSHRMNINEPQAYSFFFISALALAKVSEVKLDRSKVGNPIEHFQFHILKERRQSAFRTRNTWHYDNAAEVCK